MAREPGVRASRRMMIAIAVALVVVIVLVLTFRGSEDDVSRNPQGGDAMRSG